MDIPSIPTATERRTPPRRFLRGQFRNNNAEPPMTPAEWQFADAIDRYKRENRRPFPTSSEVLSVVLALGYRLPDVTPSLPAPPG